MTSLSRRLPLIAGIAGAILVVALTMAFRGDDAGSQPAVALAPASGTTSGSESEQADQGKAPLGAPLASPALAPAATPFALPTDQASLRALGKRLIGDAETRPQVASFEVQTASYADGSTFSIEGGTPNPITLVFFMAAWCPTCGPEAVALRELHEQYGASGVQVLILNVDQNETEEDLAAFRERTGNGTHLWAMDRDFNVALALEVNTLDATVIVDQQGRIAYRDGSPTDYGTLAAIVEALLEEGA